MPQFISAEWVKVNRQDVGGLSVFTDDDSGELFLRISVKFKYKETPSTAGRRVPLPPMVRVKREGTDDVWLWDHVSSDTLSQSSADCMQLLTNQVVAYRSVRIQDRLISEQLQQFYSPAICAESSAGGFSFYFSSDAWIPEEPDTVKSLALVFGASKRDDAGPKPIPLNPRISYKTPERK
jgi:hypothetical protein